MLTNDNVISAEELFEHALAWLMEHYAGYHFFVERDIVWTIQCYLQSQILALCLPFRIYNDHPMLPGLRRSLSADLAILDSMNRVLVAVEFKYEPAHENRGQPP